MVDRLLEATVGVQHDLSPVIAVEAVDLFHVLEADVIARVPFQLEGSVVADLEVVGRLGDLQFRGEVGTARIS